MSLRDRPEVMRVGFRLPLPLVGILAGFSAALISGPGLSVARAQNLDAGKTPAQLYAQSCVFCHRRPQEIAPASARFALEGFLRQHYTSGRDEAAMMAAYVRSFTGTAEPAQKRATRGAPKQGEQAGPAARQAKQDPKAKQEPRTKQDGRARQDQPSQAKAPPEQSRSPRADPTPAQPMPSVPQVTPPSEPSVTEPSTSEQPTPAAVREPEKPAEAPESAPPSVPGAEQPPSAPPAEQQASAPPPSAPAQERSTSDPSPPVAEQPAPLAAEPAPAAETPEPATPAAGGDAGKPSAESPQ